MGQDWLLLDLDARTKYKMDQLGDEFFHIGRDVFRMLWVPPPVPPFELKLRQDLGINTQIRDDRSLMLLPNELLDLIFVWLAEDWCDLVCFAATCSSLWYIGITHIHSHFLRLQIESTSRGHRLICLGDKTEANDLPRHLHLTDDEKKQIESDGLYTTAHRKFACNSSFSGRGAGLRSSLIAAMNFRMNWDMGILNDVLERLLPPDARLPANDNDLVLLNLSKHEFVRGSALMSRNAILLQHYKVDGYCELPCLGNALLALICWSSDPYTGIRYYKPLHRGAWAGDRFSIVPEEAHERERRDGSGRRWVDISHKVSLELREIWIAQRVLVPRRAR
ncbi:uncharacterized protein SCHCODRAFT_02686368 [Schizophyllum commune H4-8]|nr:uncharacterized protein SCHCODRAFT_02686368 [Schizophyllum commune H4-8]KAI5894861.1 hypothetical protein SCHCODRAFT_02686368 [Schizophyllum commune H4-8]